MQIGRATQLLSERKIIIKVDNQICLKLAADKGIKSKNNIMYERCMGDFPPSALFKSKDDTVKIEFF